MTYPIYIVGDIHGHIDQVMAEVKKFDLRDCVIICVGDLGIGFCDEAKERRIHTRYNDFMGSRNIRFYSIRGNHDDPAYFTGKTRVVYPFFELLEDYTVLCLNGERFLCVGGAISVDRSCAHRSVANKTYWEDEALVYKPDLIQECDVLITHSAPPWIGPYDKLSLNNFSDWQNDDPTLWDDCTKERMDTDKLIRESKAFMHYCGHFHTYAWTEQQGCYSTILGVLQFKEHHRLIKYPR